ncbi:MAG: alpha/beta hydrolase [Lacipirellulaceae bacterium]
MNRLSSLVASLVPQQHAFAGSYGGAPWAWEESGTRVETRVQTFAPQGYEPGYAYPLLVWLHDRGSSERALPKVMKHVSVRNYVAVAPRGVAGVDTFGARENRGWTTCPNGVESAEQAVADAIATARERFNVHPNRVFVAGLGEGGTMALRLALTRPELFAGAASFDGALPRGDRPLSRVNHARRVPLLLSASRHSVRYREPRVCQDLTLLHAAGFQVAVRQYPGDEELTTAMLSDLDRWVMDRVCG